MENQELNNLLEKLTQEIKNVHSVDEKGTELLLELDKDIHTLLERSGEDTLEMQVSSIQLLEKTIRHFETTHPNLTVAISKLLDTLSNAGI